MGVIMATTHAPRRHGLPRASRPFAGIFVFSLIFAVLAGTLLYGMTRPATPWAFDRQEAQYSLYRAHGQPAH